MPELSERQKMVLMLVLRDYTESAQPIGSQHLVERYHLDMSSATIRNEMVALTEMGYEVTRPEGTFYLMARSPDPDDMAFTERLATLGALVLPGTIVESPGWFRISLTASDAMVERGLEAFAAAVGR